MLCSMGTMAAITTPYPTDITLRQINSAEKERARMCQNHKKWDRQPTGFYVDSGALIVVNASITTPAASGAMPVLTVGTLGFNVPHTMPPDAGNGRAWKDFTLVSGENRITDHSGGLIYLSFVQNGAAAPTGIAQITFTDQSQHQRAPWYKYGATDSAEFAEMFQTYNTPDVLYTSDYVIVAATRENAQTNSLRHNLNQWLEALHLLLAIEDSVGGMNNQDPNAVHHRLPAGDVRYVLVQNTSGSPHASSAGYTGYPSSYAARYVTMFGTSYNPSNNSWVFGHELGHQHQQGAYMISMATESTVNLYSYAVRMHFDGGLGRQYVHTADTKWNLAHSTYLSYVPLKDRIYHYGGDSDAGLLERYGWTGNKDELRFMVWEQLILMFGYEFFRNLHRVVREENVSNGGSAAERSAYLILKASQVSGYDLTEFFNQWGIRVEVASTADSMVKADLRARMGMELTGQGMVQDGILPLPVSVEQCLAIKGAIANVSRDYPPFPLTLRGITTSQPPSSGSAMLDRTNWAVTPSYNGCADGTTGGNNPRNMLDGDNTSGFSMVKRGSSSTWCVCGSDHYGCSAYEALHASTGDATGQTEMSYTIDMLAPQQFNAIIYRHRTDNSTVGLRASALTIMTSDDNSAWTTFVQNHAISTSSAENIIAGSSVTARYVKIIIEAWGAGTGTTVQVSELNIGTYTPPQALPPPAPLKMKVNVAVSGANIQTDMAGDTLIDEDSRFNLIFKAKDCDALSLKVDGVQAALAAAVDNTYQYSLIVGNHTGITITGANCKELNSGVASVSVSAAGGAVSVVKGRNQYFTADVAASTGNPSRAVDWSIVSPHHEQTTIVSSGESQGILRVNADESADTIIVRATSAFDRSKYGQASIAVKDAAPMAVAAQALNTLPITPNPANTMLYIMEEFTGLAEVYDVSGALVLTAAGNAINIGALPAGLYIVKAGGRSAKVVKQ